MQIRIDSSEAGKYTY